jgi:amino acid adenylation domain-containing protein
MPEHEKTEIEYTGLEIAVIGMAGRFPGSRNLEEFWENLKNGKEGITFFEDDELIEAGVDPQLLKNPGYVKAQGYLEGIEYFDPSFFGYSTVEAEIMDPQIRLFHEIAWESLENAGYDPFTYPKLIGVYVGASSSFSWQAKVHMAGKTEILGWFSTKYLANKDAVATRIAHKLNLRGPGVTIDTACSTSLVAIHMASQGLLSGDCDIAIAGGTTVTMLKKEGYLYQEGMLASPDGHCRAFDAKARGTNFGNAVGAVILKRYEDAKEDGDTIHAVIRGSAINNDGIGKAGYTAPGIEGQERVIRMAQKMAEVEPETITYVETHGTGTTLGDPVEIEGLTSAFNTDKTGYCAIGSVKTNVGHLEMASGVASFIKTVLSMTHRMIPPSLFYETPSQKIDFEQSPFYVNTRLREWKTNGNPIRAGVSSFGIGGTNAHVILEEPPEGDRRHANHENATWHLLLLSAKTETALESKTRELIEYLRKNSGISLSDVAYTLQTGRRILNHRRMLVCSNLSEAKERFGNPESRKVKTYSSKEDNRTIVFIYSGLGAQYINMGAQLYQEAAPFRQAFDQCAEILEPQIGYNLRKYLFIDKETTGTLLEKKKREIIDNIQLAQVTLFVFEYALTRLLETWGVKPHAMLGYSFGEYVVACIAGVFTLEQALELVVYRGEMIQESEPGAMLSVPLNRKEITPFMDESISLAIDNGPSCVVSGTIDAVTSFEEKMKEKRLLCMRVPSSYALHSSNMEKVAEKIEEKIRSMSLGTPNVSYISNVTGDWILEQEARDPKYWANHVKGIVRFAEGIKKLLQEPNTIFIEVGPGHDISSLLQRHVPDNSGHQVLNLLPSEGRENSEMEYLLNKIGELWLYGKDIDWQEYHQGKQPQRIPLPVYPFERQRYWIDQDLSQVSLTPATQKPQESKKENMDQWFYQPFWKENPLIEEKGEIQTEKRDILVLTHEYTTPMTDQVKQQLMQKGHDVVVVEEGKESSTSEDYRLMFDGLRKSGQFPQQIICFLGVYPNSLEETEEQYKKNELGREFAGLLDLVRALGQQTFTHDITIDMVNNHLHSITNEETLDPYKAKILGLSKVIPQEYPFLQCRTIDIDPPSPGNPEFDTLVNQLVEEFSTPITGEEVAYRRGKRYIKTYELTELSEPKGRVTRLREKGVYLITGGLGHIGAALAEYLVKQVKARVILLGRTPLPPEEQWERNNQEQPDRIKNKLKKIRHLQELGGEVMAFGFDITDEKQLRKAVLQAEERFGKINGIIHAAGETTGKSILCPIANITEKEFLQQYRTKITGLRVLEQLFGEKDLDFCMMTSSLSPILGGLGFAAYASGNSFMDAFVNWHNKKRNSKWISVNWADWQLAGNLESHNTIGSSVMEYTITTQEGLHTFHRILTHYPAPQVVVSAGDLKDRIDQWIRLKSLRKGQDMTGASKTTTTSHRPGLMSEYHSPENPVQEKLAHIWQELFGFDKIGIQDDYFELGGDSLKAIAIIARIHKELNVIVSLAEFFQRATVENLSTYIHTRKEEIYESIPAVEMKEYYPVSSAQARLYVLQQLEENSVAYNEFFMIPFNGIFEKEKLENTFERIIYRHENLRTSFQMIEEQPVQRIHKKIDFQTEHMTIPEKPINIAREFIRPFDLSKPPLFRVGLIQVNKHRTILLIDIHHIVTDGKSQGILKEEFELIYNGTDHQLPLLPLQYKDYTQWQKGPVQKSLTQKQEDYWLTLFSGEIPVINLPVDYPRPIMQDFEGYSVSFYLEEKETSRLKERARDTETTLYMNLLVVLSLMLYKISNQEDIIVGTPVESRQHPDLDDIMGMFVNTLPIRTNPQPGKTLLEYLEEAKNRTLKAYENQAYPFEDLVSNLSVPRDTSRNPIFDVMFNQLSQKEYLENLPVMGEQQGYEHLEGIVRFDLHLTAVDTEEKILLNIRYRKALFKKKTIDRMIGYFKKILDVLLENPTEKISKINILTPEQKNQILFKFNDTETDFPRHKTLFQLFEETVEQHGQATAVTMSGKELTYQELNKKANQLARHLKQKNAGPNTIVAVISDRSMEMMIAIFAILKSGAAYLPIDPQYPEKRITYMLKNSHSPWVLIQGERKAFLEKGKIWELLDISDSNWYKGNSANPDQACKSEDLCYVIYTSGTTGKPKGVMVEHRAVVNRLNWMQNTYPIGKGDVLLQKTPIVFDVSVWELFWWTFNGATLHLLEPGQQGNPEAIINAIHQEKITYIHFVPSMFHTFLEYLEEFKNHHEMKSLKQVFNSGEALLGHHVKRFYHLMTPQHPVQLVNLYGPTEATVDVSYYNCPSVKEREESTEKEKVTEQVTVPIGKPIDNIRLYIVSDQWNIQPIGVAGECCIAGVGLARGYLGMPELTDQTFLTHAPFLKGERIYRTGDLAKWNSSGEIEFLGRKDLQVKIRGYRIETQEIEKGLLTHPHIKEVVVLIKESRAKDQNLCAWYTSDESLEPDELKQHLSEYLPDYMVPAYYIQLETLPLTPSGKVDRRALPGYQDITRGEYIAPRDQLEAHLQSIWSDILGIEREKISINSSFFELGGHSLMAVSLISRIHREMAVRLTLGQVFRYVNIQGLAICIQGAAREKYKTIEPVEKKEYYSLSSAQKRLYFLQQMEPETISYNIPMHHVLTEKPDITKLEHTIKQLIQRHESLRTSFQVVKEEAVQMIHPQRDLPFTLEHLETTEPEKEEILQTYTQSFDLGDAPLMRSTLIEVEHQPVIWIMDLHHIIADGSSLEILTRDFLALYNDQQLTPLKIQYKDFSEWQNQLARMGGMKSQEAYWIELFSDEIPRLELPQDHSRPAVFNFAGETIVFPLDKDLSMAFREMAVRNGGTLFMNILAALNLLFYTYTCQEDIIIGSGIIGRNQEELQSVTGMFINMLGMRNFPQGHKTYEAFLREVIKNSILAFENQEVPFEQLVSQLDLEREPSRNPLFDVTMVVQNYLQGQELAIITDTSVSQPPQTRKTSKDDPAPINHRNTTSKFDLTFFIHERGEEIVIEIEYYTAIFKRETIHRMVNHLNQILGRVVQNPSEKLKDLEIISNEEKKQVLYTFNETTREYPKEKTLFEVFEEEVKKNPKDLAISFENQALTYQEAKERALGVSGYLNQNGKDGKGTGNIIGIMVENSIEMIFGILGILKSGGAYLPIEPDYPKERVNYMLANSNTHLLFTQKSVIEKFDFAGTELHLADLFDEALFKEKNTDSTEITKPNDLAYVIYTSGSTGNPKGVLVTHRNVLRLVKNPNYIQFRPGQQLLMTGSVIFDLTTFEIWGALLNGLGLHLISKNEILEPGKLLSAVKENNIDILHMIPQLLEQAVREIPGIFEYLEYLVVGGDLVRPTPISWVRKHDQNLKIIHAYGPTENTTFTTTLAYDKEYKGKIPIGKPLSNSMVYILDAFDRPQPIGVMGELAAGGDGITRGYLNQVELTAEKYVPNPFVPGDTLYRTGDMARWLSDGNIEFLGRIDHQVKIRGIRIEPGEIENRLLKIKEIREAVVLAKEDETKENYLCAYITATEKLNIPQLKSQLSGKIPGIMVPSYVIQLEEMPVTRTGKLDRKKLSYLANTIETGVEFVAPQGELEHKVAEVWKTLLKLEEVGVQDNFFDVGGNSLKIIQLCSRLKETLNREIPVVTIFRYPTIQGFVEYLTQGEAGVALQRKKMDDTLGRLRQHRESVWNREQKEANQGNGRTGREIAVIGMTARVPGAKNIHQYWDNLKNGKETITFFTDQELKESGVAPEMFNHPSYVKAKGILEGIEFFDAHFFGYTPKEAERIDPQVRVFHECVWKVLEDAGYNPDTYEGIIGLFAGASRNVNWQLLMMLTGTGEMGEFESTILSNVDLLCSRVSYKLNLRGPSIFVQTACSTSLVAIHQANQALLTGECDIALAGGVTISIPQRIGYLYHDQMVHSPDGHCRAFDAEAKGMNDGHGAGVVALKMLNQAIEDGDHIYAKILGSAISNDGIRKAGFTAPSVEGQVETIRRAHHMAQIEAESVSYIEAHGTGTLLGDPIEIEALKVAFNSQKKGICGVGSVKTNMGHLDAASGVSGFIKAVLSLKNRMIPPSLHFKTPNPSIDFENSPFYVNHTLKEWRNDTYPLRAGVSSFGIGGTNAHVILEEYPGEKENRKKTTLKGTFGKHHLILLSAKSEKALNRVTLNLANYLKENQQLDLSNVSYTLQQGRKSFKFRRMMVGSETDQVIQEFGTPGSPGGMTFYARHEDPPIVFMFSGQGSQYVNMGLEIYQQEPLFKREVDRCFEIIEKILGENIQELLYPQEDEQRARDLIHDAVYSGPVKFAFDYALARLILSWGIIPKVMFGHSFGEYLAACISGVFSLEDALRMVVLRGQLMKTTPLGIMLSVQLSEEDLQPWINEKINLASVNSHTNCIVSGPKKEMEEFEQQIIQKNHECIRINFDHAGHSNMMIPITKEFKEKLSDIKFSEPTIPYTCSLTGKWIQKEQAMDINYWTQHIHDTVRFSDAVAQVLEIPHAIFIQVGVDKAGTLFLSQHPDFKPDNNYMSMVKHQKDIKTDFQYLIERLGELWLKGVPIDWDKVWQREKRKRVSLPTYSFEKQRCMKEVNPYKIAAEMLSQKNPFQKKKDIADWFYLPTWTDSILPPSPAQEESSGEKVLVFINDHDLGIKLVSRLRQEYDHIVIIRRDSQFTKVKDQEYTINTGKSQDYQLLLTELLEKEFFPTRIIHMLGTGERETKRPNSETETFEAAQELGFYSLIYLARGLKEKQYEKDLKIYVITSHMQKVFSGDLKYPEKSTVLAPVKVIPQEFPNMRCISMDVELTEGGTPEEEELIDQMISEFKTGTADTIIAFRQGHRWVQTYKPVRLEEGLETHTRFREKGIYLITGGLGDLGLIITKILARNYQARIILMGRTPLPKFEEREKWLAEHPEADPVSLKIKKLKALEETGAEVHYLKADVADPKQMKAIIEDIEKRFGGLHGIFHSAGITAPRNTHYIQTIEKNQCQEQFEPKAYGVMALGQALQGKKLDFCLMMSSISGVLGGIRDVAYSAANIFMDAYVQQELGQKDLNWKSVNWDGWQLEQEGHTTRLTGTTLSQMTMSPAEAEKVLKRVLAWTRAEVIVLSIGDLQERLEKWILRPTTQTEEKPEDHATSEPDFSFQSRPSLSKKYVAPRTQLETDIAEIWKGLFGYDQIGIEDDFFELGGDSLKAINVLSKMFGKLNTSLSLPEFFAQPSIQELAQIIQDQKQVKQVSVKPSETREYYPLSSAQKRLWVIQQMDKHSTVYNESRVMYLEGELEIERIQDTFRRLIQRHESLRTSFLELEGEPVQRIHTQVPFSIVQYDLREEAKGRQEKTKNILMGFRKPFDLSCAPFFRVGLIILEVNKYILILDMHHSVTDTVSYHVFVREFSELYWQKQLKSQKLQYRDYSQWQNQQKNQQDSEIKQQEAFWLAQFKGEIPQLNLPMDYERPEIQSFEGSAITRKINSEVTKNLKELALEEGVTLYMLLLSIYNVMLAKVCGQEDIIVGTSVAGRRHVDLEQIIGMFVNMLVLRNYPRNNLTFKEFLQEVKERTLNAFENQHYQFEDLVANLETDRDMSRNPLFDVIFDFQAAQVGQTGPTKEPVDTKPAIQMNPVEYQIQNSKMDLVMVSSENNGEILLRLEYCTRLFKPETIQQFHQYVETVTKTVLKDRNIRLRNVELVTDEKEKNRVFSEIKKDMEEIQVEFEI